ncbi:hypothetical protein D3C85_1368210 [compost metagenome]
MVRVMVGEQHQYHRLLGDAGDCPAHRLAIGLRGAAVDHHHAGARDDEGGVDDIAAIGVVEIVGAALQQPGALGDLPGLEVVVQACLNGKCQAGQQ